MCARVSTDTAVFEANIIHKRQLVVRNIDDARTRILEHLAHYRSQDVRQAAEVFDLRLRRLKVSIHRALRQATWASNQAHEILSRTEIGRRRKGGFFGSYTPADEVTKRVRSNLEIAESHLRTVDQEADTIWNMLLESESCVLALTVQRDELQLAEAVRHVNALLNQHLEVVEEFLLSPRREDTDG